MRVRSSGATLAKVLAGVGGTKSSSGPAGGTNLFSTACFLIKAMLFNWASSCTVATGLMETTPR
eukprot:10735507-Alexandrium_andersonii.AAC.1